MTRYRRPPLDAVRSGVAEWNARNPLRFGGRTCPACEHHGCFGALSDSADRWVCFSSDHARTGCGRSGDGCFTGDALDLEAFRSGLTRLDVLRRDGLLDGEFAGDHARRDLAPRPAPGRTAHIEGEWARLHPSGDPLDLVRFDGGRRRWVRCYSRAGVCAGLRCPSRPWPTGWLGATPSTAVVVLASRAAPPEGVLVVPPAWIATGRLADLPTTLHLLVGHLGDADAALARGVPLLARPADVPAGWSSPTGRLLASWPRPEGLVRGDPAVLARLQEADEPLRTAVDKLARAFGPLTVESVTGPGEADD